MPDPLYKRRFAYILAALVALAALGWFAAGLPLKSALENWRAGQKHNAIRTLESWRRLHLRTGDYDRLLAAVYLSAGKRDEAAPHLRAIAQGSSWFPVVGKLEVAKALVDAGRYQEFLEYDTSARELREPDEVALYRAASQLGLNRVQEAETTFQTISEGSVDGTKFAALRTALEQRKNGSYPYILAANGTPIGSINIANEDLVPVDVNFLPLIDRQGGTHSFEAHLNGLGAANSVVTTLDPDVQRAAVAALSSFRGSLVAIDTKTNDILAIASTPGDGARDNLAFDREYEPGSIVKVITGLSAANRGFDFSKFFPIQCNGFLVVDGRQFFDWAQHGTVPDINEALATSCNVSFGELGLRLGRDAVLEMMKNVGFDGAVDLGTGRVPLGRIVANPQSNYQVANLSIGLQHETVNALHVAMLASMMANRGVFTQPRLVLRRQTILGEALAAAGPPAQKRVASQQAAEFMAKAMEAVVASPRGTGRRSAVDGVPIAMKTGTSGTSAQGYDAVILAYAPAGNPRIAIGMIAEHAGPAEFAGAKIAHDFFAQVAGRLR